MSIFNLSWLFGKKPSMPPRIPMPPVPMPPVTTGSGYNVPPKTTTTAITNAITNMPKPTSTGSGYGTGLFASLHNFMLFGHQPQGIPKSNSAYGGPKPLNTGSVPKSNSGYSAQGTNSGYSGQGTNSGYGYGRKADSPKTYTYVAGGYTVNNEHPRGATWMALSTDGSLGYWVNGYVPAGTVTHQLGEAPSRSSRIGNM